MTEKIIVIRFAGVEVKRIRTDAAEIEVAVMERENSHVCLAARINAFFPLQFGKPDVSIVKGANAKWLDVYDGAFPCWPPVRRQSEPAE